MRIFGFEIRRVKAAAKAMPHAVDNRGWWKIVGDQWSGAWQQAVEYDSETILAYHAVYSCITLIANDIGKLRPKLVEKTGGVWAEISNPAFSPVLRRPNRYQNHIQFKEWWLSSKLLHGNTYGLKVRDGRGVVTAIYVLDPTKVKPLVTPSTEVFYELQQDNMAELEQSAVIVPASEIIHDRMNCLFHPLIGVSPIYACGSAGTIGVTIERNQKAFFANSSTPGGILTAPGAIAQATADRLKTYWDENFSGDNAGKVAVLGDGLKYEPMRMSAVDSQLIEQLRWTAETVCSTFHVPPFKVGVGNMPTYQNAEVLNQIYYSDCLQSLIEQFEACMDDGLGLDGQTRGVELDIDGLLRMDSATQVKTLADAVNGAIMKPDEARQKLDLPPIPGGNAIYLQQQYYSLEALSKRDADDPFAKPDPAPAPALPAPENDPEDDPEDDAEEQQRQWVKAFEVAETELELHDA